MKMLLLVSGNLADNRHDPVREGVRPKADFDALAEAVRALPGGHADILGINAIEQEGGWLTRLAGRYLSQFIALALLGYQHCDQYDVIYSHDEGVASPLAFLLWLRPWRPRHIANAFYLTGWRNAFWYRVLGVHRGLDTLFTVSREQYETGLKLKIPVSKLKLLESCGHIDAGFFLSATGRPVNERQICSAGREFRDYGTLLAAVAELPTVKLKIDPASPWSRQQDTAGHSQLPPNTELAYMKIGEVRQLYAESAVVAVPLRTNPIGAGSTTMLEAMLMGKPVIITRSRDGSFAGRRDLIDGEHVIMVDPGDVAGWRKAIERLMGDPELRSRIGAKGREWAVRYTNRKQWLEIMIDALRGPAESAVRPWMPLVPPEAGRKRAL